VITQKIRNNQASKKKGKDESTAVNQGSKQNKNEDDCKQDDECVRSDYNDKYGWVR
jgi:hypothetical protein